MDKKNVKKRRKCPKCDAHYIGYPALSRRDNKTKICSKCGMKEAIESVRLHFCKNR